MEQRRFLLAMILSGLVILVWQVFFVPEPDRVEAEDGEEVVAEEELEEAPDADAPDSDAPEVAEEQAEDASVDEVDPEDAETIEAQAPTDEDVPEIEERIDAISTGELDIKLSNRGARLADVNVTSPRQYAGEGGQLMRAFEDDAPALPYGLSFEEGNVELAEDAAFEVVEEESERSADGETYERIVYRHQDPAGAFSVDKTFSVDEERRYSLRLEVEVRNTLEDGVPIVTQPAMNIIGRDDPDKETAFFDFRPDVLEGVCHTTDDNHREVFENIEAYERFGGHTVRWAGTDTRYFMKAAVPIDGAEACSFDAVDDRDYLRTRIYHSSVTIGADDTWDSEYVLYMGPKDFDVLRDVGFALEESVDYGLFSFLARPLRWSLVRLNNYTNNWGLAIILLTLIIKLLTWKITGKAYTNAERMKQIQPEIKKIREKYEDDQQKMTEETMKVFKENNVSPLGCLPLLLQMPILYGLFVMIYNSVELYQAEFLWYADLSAPDPWFILPVVMGVVMFFQQRITMSTAASTNPQMKVVMKVMPVAFTAFMLFLPAGLVLYYLLNLMMGLSQQFLIKRKFRLAEEAGEEI